MNGLPAPRLQLRWRKPTKAEMKGRAHCNWTCVYELILPVDEHDIRRKKGRDHIALEIGRTFVGTTRELMDDTPFRDGCHAKWDSIALKGLPIYVLTSDGRAIEQIEDKKFNAA